MEIKSKLYDECVKCKYAVKIRSIKTGKIVKIVCANENDFSITATWQNRGDTIHNPLDKCPTYVERYLYNIYEGDEK